jgi:hypothetical protein
MLKKVACWTLIGMGIIAVLLVIMLLIQAILIRRAKKQK